MRHDASKRICQRFGVFGGAGEILVEFLDAAGCALHDRILYRNHAWSSSAFKFDSDFALQQLIELTAGWVGASAHYEWTLARNLAAGLAGHPAVRAALYDRLASSEATPGNRILASAIAELPDDAGILLLIDLELAWRVSLINLRTLEGLVTNQVPSPEFSNSYSVVPVPASELRRQLLHKTNDGGIDDRAAFALTLIDRIRDEHGRAIEEARHPDRTHPASPALPGPKRTLLRTLLRAHSGAVDAADYGDGRPRAAAAMD